MIGWFLSRDLSGHSAFDDSKALVLQMMNVHWRTSARLNLVLEFEKFSVFIFHKLNKGNFFTVSIVDDVWIGISHDAILLEVKLNNTKARTVFARQKQLLTQFMPDHCSHANVTAWSLMGARNITSLRG